ncbi:MAG: ABC transporter substrate-binding protein [Treponema sp.]|nr:ABC transporter substrate-binding protein [Treponema sp.]
MKKALVIACAVLLLFSAVGCGGSKGPTLTVWSFTDEVHNMVSNYYQKAFPGVNMEYSMTDQGQYENKLDPVLASGRGAPDIIVMEAAFVRKYIESGQLLDLTDIYEAYKDRLLAYPVEVGTYNGRVYGLSWQAAPGAFFYRRSLAKAYLGTDDPATVQTYFSDINTFMQTAEKLKNDSNGSCVTVASRGDIFQFMFAAREQPWIVNNRLVIDRNLELYMDIAKTMYDNRWEGRVGQWSEGWFLGMKGDLKDEAQNDVEVFGYFLPTWGLHYVLKPNTPDTSGDWAMIPGPVPYRWGGTWLGAYKGTAVPEAAKQFIRYLTVDNLFLEQYALDSGDLVSNMMVVDKIKGDYREPFLGGQNHYAEFAEMAKGVNGRLLQGTDRAIEDYFHEAVTAYVEGEKTKALALADFRNQIESLLGL